MKLIQDLKNYENYLPEKAKQFFEIYKNSFNI